MAKKSEDKNCLELEGERQTKKLKKVRQKRRKKDISRERD